MKKEIDIYLKTIAKAAEVLEEAFYKEDGNDASRYIELLTSIPDKNNKNDNNYEFNGIQMLTLSSACKFEFIGMNDDVARADLDEIVISRAYVKKLEDFKERAISKKKNYLDKESIYEESKFTHKDEK